MNLFLGGGPSGAARCRPAEPGDRGGAAAGTVPQTEAPGRCPMGSDLRLREGGPLGARLWDHRRQRFSAPWGAGGRGGLPQLSGAAPPSGRGLTFPTRLCSRRRAPGRPPVTRAPPPSQGGGEPGFLSPEQSRRAVLRLGALARAGSGAFGTGPPRAAPQRPLLFPRREDKQRGSPWLRGPGVPASFPGLGP